VDPAGNRSPRATLDSNTALCPFASRLAAVGVTRLGGARAVVVKLRVSRATTVRLRLVSRQRRVAGGTFALRPGRNVLRLRVPRRAPGGQGRLTIAIVNPDGGTLVLARTVVLPRPR
jgi:hypothetical protein